MNTPRPTTWRRFSRRPLIHIRPILAVGIATASVAQAAIFTWSGNTGNWSDPAQWVELSVPPSLSSTDLLFLGSAPYTSTNNIGPFTLNTLTLNASAAFSIAGGSFNFTTDDVAPTLTQSGAGAATISSDIAFDSTLTLNGNGTGLVSLDGILNSALGGLQKSGSSTVRLTNINNSYAGGTTITGGVLEVMTSVANGNLDLPAVGNSVLGNGGAITINGGELKLTQNGAGSILSGANAARTLTFGANGGTLNINGRINPNAASNFPITLTPGGVEPVIRFNGGPNGVSSNSLTDGNWAVDGNTLRISTFVNAGVNTPVRFEAINGATIQISSAYNNFPGKLTWRGVAGGDATVPGFDRGAGRYFLVSGSGTPATYTFNNGLFIEDTIQISIASAGRRIDAPITVRGTASGHPGNVAFGGRATGTAVTAPQAFPLFLGSATINGRTLTIEGGGTASFDARFRTDQNAMNGVQVTALTDILAGGTVKIVQSWIGTGAAGGSARPTGYIDIQGDIRGNGTAANESILEIQLPFRDGSVLPAAQNEAGVTFNTAGASGADIIVNGSISGEGGGLRIITTSRNTRGYTANNGASAGLAFADDGFTNVIKLNSDANQSILAPARLAALTGTGGYLTIAAAGGTVPFPIGAEWSTSVPVGLKVIDSNPAGDDVAIGAAFQHNINVIAGATLNAGGFTLGPSAATAGLGLIKGTGTISGGAVINTGATLAPGFGLGTLNVGDITINGLLEIEANNLSASDLLAVTGNLTLGTSSILSLPAANTYNAVDYTIATFTGALSGNFSSVTNLPANFSVVYGPTSIVLHFTSSASRKWNGNLSGVWDVGNTANWQGGATFANGVEAIFDDSASGPNFNVTVTGGDVTPSIITVNNSTKAYTLTSSPGAAIAGTAPLVKNGNGILTLSGPATYSGGTTVNGGELRLGSSNALPDVGAVTIGPLATLNIQGNSDTVASLIVNGAVTGVGTVTVGALTLGSGATFQPTLVLNGNVSKTGTAGTVIGSTIDLGGAARTFDVAVGTSPELTLGGVLSNGSLTKAGNGTLVLNAVNSLSGTTTVSGGILRVGVAGALPAGSNVTVGTGASLDLNAIPHTFGTLNNSGSVVTGSTPLSVTQLSGGASGVILLDSATLTIDQTGTSSYLGGIDGLGAQVIKLNTGVLTLGGSSSFAGGLFVNAGRVNVTNSAAGGFGGTTVAAGATLQFGSTLNGPVNVNGGTLSTSLGANQTNVVSGDLFINSPSTIHTYNEDTQSESEFVLSGTLRGSGDLNIVAAPNDNSADGGSGLRFRGGGFSDYTGVITLNQRVKLELQSNIAGFFSPIGTAKIVAVAGTTFSPGSLQGTYSQIQTRTNSASVFTFGNNIEISGTGAVNFNVLGTDGSTAVMGDLKIGAGQSVFFNKNDASTQRTIAFPTVTLTGGNATFSVYDRNFRDNANNTSVGANVELGIIGETTPGAGAIFKSAGGDTAVAPFPHVTITGVSTYTGPTDIQTGILSIGFSGSIASSSEIKLSSLDSKLDVLSIFGGYTIPQTQKLGGIGDWDGRILLDGTLAPDPGIAMMTGDDLSFNGTGKLQFQLSLVDNSSDRIALLGAFDKGSAGNYVFDFQGTGAINQTYTLATFTSTTFAATDFSYIGLAPGLGGTFVLHANDLMFVTIPEPSAALLCAAAGAVVALRRRRGC